MNRNHRRFINESKEAVCAQCSGELTRKEINTRLCPCGYKICHWCLSKVLQSKNCCPECGRNYSYHVLHLMDNSSESQYSDSSSTYSNEQERKRNNNVTKMSHSDLSYLQNVRIIQRNLVYIIGIAPSIAEEKIIQSEEFFGQYGTIKKIILNNSPQLIEKVHSCCAYKLINDLTKRYITYSTEQEAYDCIMATDGCVLYDCQIRASFGTTKYCNFFLRGIHCTNSECMYLHQIASDEDCFTKKEMQARQSEFYSRTHPCHSDMTDVPLTENRFTLPPPNRPSSPSVTSKKSEVSCIRNPFSSVFGLKNSSSIDCSDLLMNEMLMEKPFDVDRILKSEAEKSDVLKTMIADECLTCLSSSSVSSIDLPFLLNVDDYLKQIHKQRNQPIESWNWRQFDRSNSIDSNVPVEV